MFDIAFHIGTAPISAQRCEYDQALNIFEPPGEQYAVQQDKSVKSRSNKLSSTAAGAGVFWAEGKNDPLLIQRCTACHRYHYGLGFVVQHACSSGGRAASATPRRLRSLPWRRAADAQDLPAVR
jgi:hypothetical protein